MMSLLYFCARLFQIYNVYTAGEARKIVEKSWNILLKADSLRKVHEILILIWVKKYISRLSYCDLYVWNPVMYEIQFFFIDLGFFEKSIIS